MSTKRAAAALLLLLSGCLASHHPAVTSALGTPRRSADLLAVIDEPGPLEVTSVNSADWQVDRSGLINLDSPKAREAKLEDTLEPIQLYFHVIKHPKFGTFIVDSGIERAIRDSPKDSLFSGLVGKVMHADLVVPHQPLGDWLAAQPEPVKGVFLTHLHLDHVSGLRDLPADTAIYAGPGETTDRAAMNFFTNGIVDDALAGKGPVSTWQFQPDADGRFDGVLDVFGDGSLWALWVPGHTKGSVAFLAGTAAGPVLLTGDTSHTVWGWDHDVEPGTFTADQARNRNSLAKLRRLASEHPKMDVRLGHQSRTPGVAVR